jgi:hypothetical protein
MRCKMWTSFNFLFYYFSELFPVFLNKLRKDSLNNDFQQFLQYQKNEQSTLILTQLTENRHMTLKIQVLPWDKHKNMTGLNRLMGFKLFPFDKWIFNDNTYIYA